MADPVLMSPWIPVLAAFGGSAISGIINYLINLSNKKSEEQKHRLSIVVQSAIEDWKQHNTNARLNIRNTGKTIRMLPLDAYIIHMSKLLNILEDKNLSSETVKNKILELHEFSDRTHATYKEFDAKH